MTLTQRLGLDLPLLLAPMAGGPSTPALAATVSNAGGLGAIPGGYVAPEQFARDAAKTRELTDRPLNMNLFANEMPPKPADPQIEAANERLNVYREELGLARGTTPATFGDDFDALFRIVLDAKPAVFSFTFGIPPRAALDACRANAIFTIGTVTTVGEGKAMQEAGVDAVCAQGFEAGGHRGGEGDVGLVALVPLLVNTLTIPVVASGGIMTREGVKAALELGAQAVQLGTAFLLCPEAGTSAPYREAIRKGGRTAITKNFSGRSARGLENRFMREPIEPLPYPYQNALTRDIRKAAASAGRAEYLSLWAGQGVALVQEAPAAEIVARLFSE